MRDRILNSDLSIVCGLRLVEETDARNSSEVEIRGRWEVVVYMSRRISAEVNTRQWKAVPGLLRQQQCVCACFLKVGCDILVACVIRCEVSLSMVVALILVGQDPAFRALQVEGPDISYRNVGFYLPRAGDGKQLYMTILHYAAGRTPRSDW